MCGVCELTSLTEKIGRYFFPKRKVSTLKVPTHRKTNLRPEKEPFDTQEHSRPGSPCHTQNKTRPPFEVTPPLMSTTKALFVNEEPAQNPIEYVQRILDCFGSIDEIEVTPPLVYTTNTDWPEEPPCHWRTDGQFPSPFWSFEDTPPLVYTTKSDCPGEPDCWCMTDGEFPSPFCSFEDNETDPASAGPTGARFDPEEE